MGRKRIRFLVPAMLALGLGATSLALAASQGPKGHGHGKNATQFRAHLTGHQETPAIHTNATGSLKLTINDDATKLTFELTYSGLTSVPSAAHVHFGQPNYPGGVSFFFCGGGGKPACPATTSGTVTGEVVAADVVGPAAQGIAAGDLAGIVQEIRAGFAYANIHNANYPGGEIRGQLYAEHGFGHKRGHGRH
jgi:hypothetical protein